MDTGRAIKIKIVLLHLYLIIKNDINNFKENNSIYLIN